MSPLIVGMDNTIVNVALPAIRRELHASVSALQWTVDAYTVVLASLLILAGSTGDRVGRRRTFQAGLILFTLGSLLCSLAWNAGSLIVFRMVQAVGGSMLNPVAMSIISNTFTDTRERARAIGVWGATGGISMTLGPFVGGALVDAVGWRAIFWINIPVGLAALVLTALFVPESKAARLRRFDPVGQALVIVTLASLTYAIIEGPGMRWGAPILGLFGLTALAVAALLWYEPRRADPLLNLEFFRSVPFSGANVMAVAGFAAHGGFLFLNTLYLQDVRGFSPFEAGVRTVPMALMIVLFAPISGRIVGSRGPRVPLLVGGIAIGASGLMLTALSRDTPTRWLLASYVIFGVGFGMFNTPITNTAVSGMPRSQAGLTTAVASTSRQVGTSLGVAVVGSVVTARRAGSLETSLSAASHIGGWIITGCGACVLATGILTTTRWARATAERTASRFAPDQAEQRVISTAGGVAARYPRPGRHRPPRRDPLPVVRRVRPEARHRRPRPRQCEDHDL